MNLQNLIWLGWGLSGAVSAADALALATVSRAPATGSYSVDGTIQAVRQSVVSAQLAGRVLQLTVRAGDTVKAGQVIARLDDRELGAAEASSLAAINEAQANLVRAEIDLKRSRALAKQNFISASAVDQADAQTKALRARVEALRAGAGAANATRSHAVITAPYEAVVAATQVEVGDLAMPGKPLVTLFQPGALRVVAYVSDAQLAAVRAGLAKAPPVVELGEKRLVGTQTTVLPAADPTTRTTEIRIDLPAGTAATPGQYVRARFAVGETAPLAIPAVAILHRGELTAVYVKTPDGRYQQRQIRLGERLSDGRMAVLAGVREGESVALDPVKAGITQASR